MYTYKIIYLASDPHTLQLLHVFGKLPLTSCILSKILIFGLSHSSMMKQYYVLYLDTICGYKPFFDNYYRQMPYVPVNAYSTLCYWNIHVV